MAISCPICDGVLEFAFENIVLCKHNAMFDFCPHCGFMRARNPLWLAEAYSSAIASTDTGLVMRNDRFSEQLASLLYGVMGERGNGRYADVAGGYGMLTRKMRDFGFDYYWSDKYCENLLAKGFEYLPEIGPCQAVTAVEIMEHLEDPLAFVRQALEQTQSSTFIFTTELFEGRPPAPDDWLYYSFETGQHIAFFQKRTLEFMANKLGLKLSSSGGVHVFSKNKINESLFKLSMGRMRSVVTWFAKGRLGSKTMSDHMKMVRQLRDAR